MSKKLMIALIAVAVFFVIGMIVGDYNCTKHFCNTVVSLVNCVTDIIKTETAGITWTFSSISKLIG